MSGFCQTKRKGKTQELGKLFLSVPQSAVKKRALQNRSLKDQGLFLRAGRLGTRPHSGRGGG